MKHFVSRARICLRALLTDTSGQTTVEYLVVALAFFALIAGLAVLGGRVQEGLFIEHATESASHALTTNTAGSVGDVLLY
ncbi:MAG: hypothetical protein FWG00_05405 [Coriobacteriia bacterium]|jgi:Flp pilus assembly pilin Flp|nr:hypothetical protein [Coriobacteriia bacterium]MDR2714794.1 hypothetical protein [Coriobacteriales bacterium]